MSGSHMVRLNLNGILPGMLKAIDAVVKENPAVSIASVRDHIAEDKTKIDRIVHDNGSSKAMQEAAWSLAVVSLLHFLLVQEAIASFYNGNPSANGTIH